MCKLYVTRFTGDELSLREVFIVAIVTVVIHFFVLGGLKFPEPNMSRLVLIVGAGPVGLAMAMALRRAGVEVRIVDKAKARSDTSKALVLWPRTLEMLDIHECAQAFVDAGVKARGARIVAGRRTLIHVDLGTAPGRYSYALMLAQSDTERLLEEQLTWLGVPVERQVELVSFINSGDDVTAILRHADGKEETLQCAYLTGCDGAHSAVRHGLNAKFEGSTSPSHWLLADVILDGDISQDELTICWTPKGVLACIPFKGSRFRVIADMGSTAADALPSPGLQEVQTLIDERAPTALRARDPVWTSRFRINERKIQHYRYGRVFLSGDAAHVHSPAGGQGMNTGMQDAFNLAWKLAMVWHGKAAATLLDSYSPERSRVGDTVLRNAGNMTRVATLRNPLLQQLRNLAIAALGSMPALRRRLVYQLSEMDLHYRGSPLTFKSARSADYPRPGERAPDIALTLHEGKESRLHELLSANKFVVLTVGSAGGTLPVSLHKIAIAAYVMSSPHYQIGYSYLIRPDAYVAMSIKATHPTAIGDRLTQLVAGN